VPVSPIRINSWEGVVAVAVGEGEGIIWAVSDGVFLIINKAARKIIITIGIIFMYLVISEVYQ
jgi:hypothetical protein